MIGSRRRTRSSINVWPGYVDALSALLMLIIFMLLIYVVSQLYLSQTLSDRDSELARLNSRLQEISRLLGLEQEETAALENEMAAVQNRFSESLALNDTLREELEEEKARRLSNNTMPRPRPCGLRILARQSPGRSRSWRMKSN